MDTQCLIVLLQLSEQWYLLSRARSILARFVQLFYSKRDSDGDFQWWVKKLRETCYRSIKPVLSLPSSHEWICFLRGKHETPFLCSWKHLIESCVYILWCNQEVVILSSRFGLEMNGNNYTKTVMSIHLLINYQEWEVDYFLCEATRFLPKIFRKILISFLCK